MQAIVATRDFHRSARRIPCVECVEDSDGGAAFQERYEEEHEEIGQESLAKFLLAPSHDFFKLSLEVFSNLMTNALLKTKQTVVI